MASRDQGLIAGARPPLTEQSPRIKKREPVPNIAMMDDLRRGLVHTHVFTSLAGPRSAGHPICCQFFFRRARILGLPS